MVLKITLSEVAGPEIGCRGRREGVDWLGFRGGPLPRVDLYARVSTPHQHTIGMQLRQLREFLERCRWQEVLVVEEVVSGSRRHPERDRLLGAARRREIDIIASGTYRFRDQRPRLE